jgi:hypothetical protein
VTVSHDDFERHAIRQGPYSLEALSLPQDHLVEYCKGIKGSQGTFLGMLLGG